MEVELLQDVVDRIRPFAVPVYLIKRIAGGLHRQHRDVEVSQSRGTVEMRDVMQREMLLSWLSSSTKRRSPVIRLPVGRE
jgi:hypothetical protein